MRFNGGTAQTKLARDFKSALCQNGVTAKQSILGGDMEPVSVLSTVGGVVKTAEVLNKIDKWLKETEPENLAKEDANYYSANLEAAALAVQALETNTSKF
jgi:hypothetical protein